MSKKYAEEKSLKNRDFLKTIFLTRQEISFRVKNRD